jgi:hypothetical protein
MVETMLSSALPIQELQELRPDFCITIHDDLYAVGKRLHDRGFPLNYQQLLLWRSAELLVADLVAGLVVRGPDLPDPPNFWLGAKHPRSSVIRLLRDWKAPKVYAAFSISGILKIDDAAARAQLKDETTEYRTRLYDRGLIVFDPATLDDRLLINDVLGDLAPTPATLVIEAHKRWPFLIRGEENRPAVEDPAGLFPLQIAHAEAFLLKGPTARPHQPYSDIDAHITQIDLRYVSQADFVTVWRPFNQGIPSAGCFREAASAASQGKEVIAFCPQEDLRDYENNPASGSRPLREVWPTGVPLIPGVDEFWRQVDLAVERLKAARTRRLGS